MKRCGNPVFDLFVVLSMLLVISITAPMAVDEAIAAPVSDGSADEGKTPEGEPCRLRVATAQISVTRYIASNIKTISRAIDEAVKENADILLTPEGSLSGYTHQFDQSQVEAALEKIVAKASSSGLALALGTC